MKVIDKREVVFRDRRTELLFPGSGQSLDNNKDIEKSQDHSKTKIHSLESVKETGIVMIFIASWVYVLRSESIFSPGELKKYG